MLDYRNLNTLWTSIMAETLYRLALTTVVVSPGSRSGPLSIAFARHPHIEAIPILDERSAAFFALGIAKRQGKPVALICTSGTAIANYYPAVIEAKMSHVPLLIITADRPPELRDCHAGQTIDQLKFYGSYCNWQVDLSPPDMQLFPYLRQTLRHAWEHTLLPTPGPVQVNAPLRDPLAPVPQNLSISIDERTFFAGVIPIKKSADLAYEIPQEWLESDRILIIAGIGHTDSPLSYCEAIDRLSSYLGAPVLAESLSPVRNFAHLHCPIISTYDMILRHYPSELVPEIVIQLGELPTSKELRQWLDVYQPYRWIISPWIENFDPLHSHSYHLPTTIQQLTPHLPSQNKISSYLQQWREAESSVRKVIHHTMISIEDLIEGKISWLLSQYLPSGAALYIANSMSVRYTEFFYLPNESKVVTYFNRGANGIDGTLSTALGVAHGYEHPTVLLTGDLALLHDINGLLIEPKFRGGLTILLVNNHGGGIFEMLPVAEFEPPFEEFFATPQSVNFTDICRAYGVEHQLINSWEELQHELNHLLDKGIRILEIPTNRKSDAAWLKGFLSHGFF